MDNPVTVLIGDRNPRIRNFLQRELNSAGYRAVAAQNGAQLKSWLGRPIQLDVLVLDPDMPGVDTIDQLTALMAIRPDLPVVFHCLVTGPDSPPQLDNHKTIFVEKTANSVDHLKKQLRFLLIHH